MALRAAAAFVLAAVVLAACSGQPDVKDRAREQVRTDVGQARAVFAQALQRGDFSKDSLQVEVDERAGARVLIARVEQRQHGVVVTAVVTASAEDGGLVYEAWSARACLELSSRPGVEVTSRNVACPTGTVPELEPVDEVLTVDA